MARTKQILTDGVRVNDYIAISLLGQLIPQEKVAEILKRYNRETLRNRKLPREFLVYYVIGLALYSGLNAQAVLKAMLESLSYVNTDYRELMASEASLSSGRINLGFEVMRELFHAICRPQGKETDGCSYYKKWRLTAIDGSSFDLADEAAIRDEFPKHSNGVEYPYPQLKFVALMELGTRSIIGAEMGNDRNSEKELASVLLGRLTPDMLLIGDRYYMSHELFDLVDRSGAAVLFRARSNFNLTPEKHLPDGSYLTRIYDGRTDRRRGGGKVVRVIEYRIGENGSAQPEVYRLVTNILDHELAPAEELARLYHQRWEIETGFDELKNHLKLPRSTFRSKRPDLVKQEFWGYLLAHYLVRHVIYQAASARQEDPDRISFSGTLEIIRRKNISQPFFPDPAANQGFLE